ncbi:hypothetical protein Tco_1127442 [Tanacetum coccineum]
MGCGLCLHSLPLIAGRGRGLVSCGYGSRLEIVVDTCAAFLVSQRASAEGGGSYFIDASVCPIFVPWYNNVSVKKDPLPSDDIVDFEPLEKLDNNRTMITKYPETLMCLVGFILSFSDPTAHPTLLCRDKSDMGLLDFVKSPDPSNIKTGERTFTPGEVPLLTKTADMVVNPSPKRSVL